MTPACHARAEDGHEMPDAPGADHRSAGGPERQVRDSRLPGESSGGAAPREPERNWLLGALTPAEYATVRPFLDTVALAPGQRLGPPHEPIPYVYFPQSGVVSMLKRMADGTDVEVGTVGAEGMSGLAVFLGGSEMPTECVVQIGGLAKRIVAGDLQALSREGGPLRDVLLCYTQYLFDQVAQSVACDRLHPLDQRCARWLLTTHDRVGAGEFAVTHEQLAGLLGVRRAGVSAAAEALRAVGAVEYRRGKVRILDAARLEAAACECYRATRDDFDRLLGRTGRRRGAIAG
jgi:CRP-like cAMP-binding protein